MRDIALAIVVLGAVGCGDDSHAGDDAPGDDASVVDADRCTGTCECLVDSDCPGAHAVCDDQGTSRTCACAAGFSGASCAWTGVVEDPGFQSAARWGTERGAAVEPNLNETGMVDPGAVRYTKGALCQLGRLTQAFEMPRFSSAGPLVAELSYRYTYTEVGPQLPAQPAFALASTWQDQASASGFPWALSRTCLGGGQYAPADSHGPGAIVELALSPANVPTDCNADGNYFDVDHFEVKPANPNECPAPGDVLDGDAETAGWTFTMTGSTGTRSAMIEPGVGEGATRGVRLSNTNRCSTVTASTLLSIPAAAALPSPALSAYVKVTAAASDIVAIPTVGGIALPAIPASGAAVTQKVCVPAPMRGTVMKYTASLGASGTCADVINASAVFDNVKLVDEPACGTDPNVADPGFESGFALIGATATPGKSIARIVEDPSNVNSGARALQLQATSPCATTRWTTRVVVMAPGATMGPALTFHYKATPMGTYTFRPSTGIGGTTFTPVLDNQWHQGTLCLDPQLAERAQPVQFELYGGGGTCANTIPAETTYVDDLAVTLSTACPRQ